MRLELKSMKTHYLLSTAFVKRSYHILASIIVCLTLSVFTGCDEADPEKPQPELTLSAERLSNTAVSLSWNSLDDAAEYQVWRIDNDVDEDEAQLLHTVNGSVSNYIDQELPVSTSLTYYVTTIIDNQQIISNEIELEGAQEQLTLSATKYSDYSVWLSWNTVSDVNEIEIWRVDNQRVGSLPELIATTNIAEDGYLDENLPISSSLRYYIKAVAEAEEIKSNELTVVGAPDFLIHPYQMELIPGEDLAVVRDYSAIFLIDYKRAVIVKKMSFPNLVGQMDLQMNNGVLELFVPCWDNQLYILKASDLSSITTVDAGTPISAVAVNGLGKIFCSGNFGDKEIRMYDRATLTVVREFQGESHSSLALKGNNNLLTVSSGLSPATMSYYTISNEGFVTNKTDDPYSWDYEMEPERTAVSDQYVVTSREGFVYTADHNMTYIGTITAGEDAQSDFEFGSSSNTVYSAVTDRRSVLKSVINGNGTISSSSLTTTGYPWVLARDGNTLVILSSPVSFELHFTTNSVIVETLTIQ